MGRKQHPVEVHNVDEILDELEDRTAIELLREMLIQLKKIEYHLSIGSDTELKDQDV